MDQRKSVRSRNHALATKSYRQIASQKKLKSIGPVKQSAGVDIPTNRIFSTPIRASNHRTKCLVEEARKGDTRLPIDRLGIAEISTGLQQTNPERSGPDGHTELDALIMQLLTALSGLFQLAKGGSLEGDVCDSMDRVQVTPKTLRQTLWKSKGTTCSFVGLCRAPWQAAAWTACECCLWQLCLS